MAKTKVKAKVLSNPYGLGFQLLIYTGGMWRLFGTPYAKGHNRIKPYKTATAARRGAEKTATALGITLVWEG